VALRQLATDAHRNEKTISLHYLEKWSDWLCDDNAGPFNAALAFVALYCLLQIVVMTLLSHWAGTGVGVDESEQLMYMRFLSAGYGGSQPPLFTWLAGLTASVFGTNILALKIVKYLLIGVALISFFAAILRLGYSSRTASAGTFGLLLFPQMVWEMQHALTHSTASLCFSAVLLLALVEVLKRRSLAAYVLLGLAAAAVMLSKYNNVIFLGALFFSALSLREARTAILHRYFVVSVAVAVLACLPTFYWSLTHLGDLLAHSSGFGIARGSTAMETARLGLLGLGKALLNFAALPSLVFAVAFLLAFRKPGPSPQTMPWTEKLLWRAIFFALCIALVLVLVSGATQFRDRWMLPVLVLLPAAIAMRLDTMGERGRKTQGTIVFVGAILAILVLPVSWYMHLNGGEGRGRIVRMDYPSLLAQMTTDGPVGTVISSWFWVGNLRLVDPDLVVLDDEIPDFALSIREPAVLILTDDEEPTGVIFDRIAKAGYAMDTTHRRIAVPQLLGSTPPTREVTVTRLKKVAAAPAAPAQ
jgi:dolichyl-phosphate-mannose-protein mannosyltransferase